MKPGLSGIEVDSTIFRPASFIEISIENLSRAMMLGSLMVVLVLIAFLYEWRAALISQRRSIAATDESPLRRLRSSAQAVASDSPAAGHGPERGGRALTAHISSA